MAGENHFSIAPVPGGTLTHALAAYTGLYGTVASGWTRSAEAVHLTVTVPPNSTADIRLPDGTAHAVGPGTHEYVVWNTWSDHSPSADRAGPLRYRATSRALSVKNLAAGPLLSRGTTPMGRAAPAHPARRHA
ncbi:alpha-L-rhamnosidase C-terminal domain-containing protein [Streptomyces sp. NPDC059679]|uniref:alpha-L-rhamnosidase C-terminal domain-containing protein n=1 Tax=Streptomyces sp. NPDC059679 TaxID=3346903 RepID=UPI0036C40951